MSRQNEPKQGGALPSVPLQPVVRCNQFQHGICDNPELYGGRGSTSPCPHSIPHSPFSGCDKEEAGCPIFAPIVPPCKCVAIDTPNPKLTLDAPSASVRSEETP